MADILVVDDDTMLCKMLTSALGRLGHSITTGSTLSEGIKSGRQNPVDIVLLDVQLPDGNGLKYLPDFANLPSAPEVIIMTGLGDPDGAKVAIELGAWNYLEKPHIIQNLPLTIARSLQYRKEKLAVKERPIALKRDKITGNSPALLDCLNQVAAASSSDASVLIGGETGTGKEVFAHTIHDNSKRADESFVIVDCTSLPEHLIESILFGHKKGAFTGADRTREGLISIANKGTLFLDEIGELSLSLQKKFLRVLQEMTYLPVGEEYEKTSNFRLISATNRNLEEMVDQGLFRKDLLFRLKTFAIDLPPLRLRTEDIRDLSNVFTNKFCDRLQIEPKGISSEFIEHLTAYSWPGNIRELQQVLEQVIATHTTQPTLLEYHLPQHIRIANAQATIKKDSVRKSKHELTGQCPLNWKQFKAEGEKTYITDLMSFCDKDINQAIDISGLSRARIYQLLKRYQ